MLPCENLYLFFQSLSSSIQEGEYREESTAGKNTVEETLLERVLEESVSSQQCVQSKMKWNTEMEYILRQVMEDDNGKLARKLTLSVRTQNDRREFWNLFTMKYYNACGFKEGDGRERPNKEDIRKKWSYMLQQDKKKHDKAVLEAAADARRRAKYTKGTGGGPGMSPPPLLDPDTLSSSHLTLTLFDPLPGNTTVFRKKPKVHEVVVGPAENYHPAENYVTDMEHVI